MLAFDLKKNHVFKSLLKYYECGYKPDLFVSIVSKKVLKNISLSSHQIHK